MKNLHGNGGIAGFVHRAANSWHNQTFKTQRVP